MRLARYNLNSEPVGRARTGALVADGVIGDLRAGYARYLVEELFDAQAREIAALRIPADVRQILHVGKAALAAVEQALSYLQALYKRDTNARGLDGEALFTNASDVRLHNPLKPPRIIVADDETVSDWAPASVMGPVRGLWLPPSESALTHRAGLAIVFGHTGIAGYTVANAVSGAADERLPYRRCIIGPHLVTPEHVSDIGSLRVVTRVNEKEASAHAIGSREPIERLIAKLSMHGLEAGDTLVLVSRAADAPLRPDDVLETEIAALGTMRNKVVSVRH